MIALSCFLFTFVCLAQSRRYYNYGQYNHGKQGKALEIRLYVYRLWRLDGCWDQKAFDFSMTVETSDSDEGYSNNKEYYHSFKIFSRFWLVKTTRIIHHNQLLFTKFGNNLRHIESMTSKVELSENYWTNDVKMTSKVQPAADYWTVAREHLGTMWCCIWWTKLL